MKNFIKYYYNLNIDDYKTINNNIYFIINNTHYEFINYNGNINRLMSTYSLLITYNIYCHEILLNKDNSLITNYEGQNYILIKEHISDNNYITINNIYAYDIFIRNYEKINWKVLWEEKLDYYEYQMSELGLKYKKLMESFSYYSGLCECAISLLNYVDYKNVRMNISHNRIKFKETLSEFTNPINIIVDNITRDIASYIKSNAIYGNLDIETATNYIKTIKLTNDEYILFLSRMLYPSYYFDMYDEIIKGTISEDEIDKIIKKSNSFELLLKKLYMYIRNRTSIPNIDWLHYSNYL